MLGSTKHFMQKKPAGALLRRGLWARRTPPAVLTGGMGCLCGALSAATSGQPRLPGSWGLRISSHLLFLCHSGLGQVLPPF